MTGTSLGWQTLVRDLRGSGVLSDDWAAAFTAVPRAGFLPDRVWPFRQESGTYSVADRAEDPDAWQRWAESDVPLVTQWDDGGHTGSGPGRVSTSSASMPSVVARMLDQLEARPGMRILEIGTGTGWSAALLAHRFGSRGVTSVEVDEAVAARARTALRGAGLAPNVRAADGLKGCPEGAPYDRIIATCGLREIPAAWLEQARPGGVILAPWGTDYSSQDALVRLVVSADGTSASGRFTGPAQFMKARSQRLRQPPHAAYVPDFPGDATRTSTRLTADDLGDGDPYDVAGFAIGLRVPACAHTVHRQTDGTTAFWFYGLTDKSWAVAAFPSGDVHQSGPRRLWDEVESAFRWWDGQGRPSYERLSLTVTSDGTQNARAHDDATQTRPRP
ncbi:methyltransferase domain-containing protein [Streptomyces sp. NPDC048172]|uniref:methyltransferase domain-containing protein n=1 Tax=Streptomyces sp. NPDC048172 TaxID=3365505 RepID=UPI003715434F